MANDNEPREAPRATFIRVTACEHGMIHFDLADENEVVIAGGVVSPDVAETIAANLIGLVASVRATVLPDHDCKGHA